MWKSSYMFVRNGRIILRCYSTDVEIKGLNIKLDTLSRRKLPGLKSPKKLWWTKEITSDLYIAGGLTERQLKYANDGGFKSVVSLYVKKEPGVFGGELLATSLEAENIANIAGIQYKGVLQENEDFMSTESIKRISDALSSIQKPALLYSSQLSDIAFATLMCLAYESKRNPNSSPRVNSEQIYKMGVVLGIDFTEERKKSFIAEITGESIVQNPPKANAVPPTWFKYWLAQPVYKNWFTAGQIRRGHLQEIESAGFKSVINMRQGVTHNGKPAQEWVNLINIEDGQQTYDDKYQPLRQSESTLKSLVINPSLDNSYISPTSEINYETRNAGEYGDDVGQNEETERQHFKESKLNYYHLPLDLNVKYSPEVFSQYKDTLLEIGEKGPVLFHCAIGKRVAFMGVLAAALQYKKDLTWAVKRVNELGFEVTPTSGFTDVYEMYKGWLSPGK